jgi:hypothetical protein
VLFAANLDARAEDIAEKVELGGAESLALGGGHADGAVVLD